MKPTAASSAINLNRLQRKFPEALREKRLVCLHIPDDYEFIAPRSH